MSSTVTLLLIMRTINAQVELPYLTMTSRKTTRFGWTPVEALSITSQARRFLVHLNFIGACAILDMPGKGTGSTHHLNYVELRV